jgi:hypothetical protein
MLSRSASQEWTMPRLLIVSLALVVAGTARAGVHNLGEVHPYFQSLDDTRGYYLRLRSASLPSKGQPTPESFKGQILHQVAVLEQQKAEGIFSTNDLITLSGAYLRLGGDRIAAARRLLLAGDQSHFLVQSNLAAAYFLSGELEMAVRHQQRALDLWPAVFAGWSDQYLRGMRELERYLLKLYHLRADELRRGPLRGPVEVDALFPGVRFVGPSGDYEAGALATPMRDLMPTNAFDIVYRLNLWFPTDMRLYWLLGEMYNVAGSIDQAHDVFVELVESGMARSFKDLAKHRRALIEAKPIYTKLRDPAARGVLLTELLAIGRPTIAPPAVGDAAYLAGCAAVALYAPHAGREPFTTSVLPSDRQAPVEKKDVFNFSHVALGFAFGFVIASLCALQWLELRRRRLQAAAPREEREPVPISPPEGSTPITPGG